MNKISKASKNSVAASTKALNYFKKFKITREFVKKLKEKRAKTKQQEKIGLNTLPKSEHHLKRMINKAMIAINIPHAHEMIGRKEIIEIAAEMGVSISRLQATEIILRARGPQLEENRTCNLDEIVAWFKENCEILRPIKKHNKSVQLESARVNTLFSTTQDFSSKTFRKGRKEFSAQPRIHRRTGNSFDTKSSMLSKLKKMGPKELRNNPDFMKDVNECLQNMKELPSLRKKTQKVFSEMEKKMFKTQKESAFSAIQRSRMYLSLNRLQNLHNYKKKLDSMIMDSSRITTLGGSYSTASSVIRLSRLLARPYFKKEKIFDLNSTIKGKRINQLKL
ncbi:unnamed protein product [Moneuplotes crassus]|uniref:Uncharacterized protein n=1 Tax=Euplotes crassus TaxID=5936 RepID=A0AAD1XLP3_EUPCR|nr:unnamed protein product [Moneuplotes crassus]